ncbi:MAG: 2Fe-2S iron-sulfur cluster-binding protein [Actinomycetota bacterium]
MSNATTGTLPDTVEFHQLKVADVQPETDDSVSITLEVPEDLTDRFVHLPGQHLVVRRDLGGEDVRRSYSICSAPGDGLRIGIKRIPDGVFSTWATTELAVGDVIEVMAPIGEFTVASTPEVGRNAVLVAAGSGITPVLAMASTILRDEPASRVTLLYGNRTSRSIMFHEELEGLKNRHPERFRMIHVLSREPHEIPLFEGRIDGDKLRRMSGALIDVTSVDGWYLCGPLSMVEELSTTLGELGVDADRIHSELFFDQRIEAPPPTDVIADGAVETLVTIDGRTSVVHVDPEGPSLLDYARSVRAEVPFACKGGMCATCKAQVVDGEVTMAKNYALTAEELEAGMILTCQAHPTGDGPLAISYDVRGGVGR